MNERAYYNWKDEYSLGIESIDKEHEKLFLMVKILHRYMEEKASQGVVNMFLGEVAKHVETHFENEERFMKDKAVPEDFLKQHIMEHKRLLRQIDSLEATRAISLTDDVVQFLAGLIKDHMFEYDKKIVEFING